MTMVVETTGNDVVLSSPNMLVKVNSENNNMNINGIINIPMFPTVKSKGTPIAISIPTETELKVGGSATSYSISYPENFASDVFASIDIEVTDDYVEQIIIIENTGDKELNVDIEILPYGEGQYFVYAPYKRDIDAGYLWLSSALANERGEGLVIAFNNLRPTYDLPQEINIKSNFVRVLAWTVPLADGETKSIGVKYRPGYITDDNLLEENQHTPLPSKQYLLDTGSNPLFEITGAGASDNIKPDVPATATGTDILEMFKQTLDSIPDTSTSESTLSSLAIDLVDVVNHTETGINSVEKALLFRELSRREGLPSEIHLGIKDNNYYAWAVSYIGSSGFTYDPAGKKGDYDELYVEPESANCRGELYSCPWSSGIRTDLFCVGPICIPAYFLIALFVLVFIAAFPVFQYKTEFIYKLIGIQKGESMLTEDTLDGAYDIVNEKFLPNGPLETAVWNALRRRGGTFKADDYVTETGFSEVLVKSVIESFQEKGVIKRH